MADTEMPTPEVQNAGDFLGASTFIVSTIKVFTSPCIISPMLLVIIILLMQKISANARELEIKQKCISLLQSAKGLTSITYTFNTIVSRILL